MKAYKGSERTYQIVIRVIVVIITLTCLFPFIYVLGMSFTSEGELLQRNYFVIIPKKPIITAYTYIFKQGYFFTGMKISIGRSVAGTFLGLALLFVGANVLAKTTLPGRKWMLLFVIVTMLLNGGIIPAYLLMSNLHLVNNFWVLVLPAMADTFGMLVIKVFIENIPQDIIDSADIDGAGELSKMLRIIGPLTVPVLAAIGLFTAVRHWNAWFDAMVFLRTPALFPVQLIVRNLLVQAQLNETMAGSLTSFQKMTPETLKMAAVVIGMLPILCVYPFLQKYFIHGMFTGSVKG